MQTFAPLEFYDLTNGREQPVVDLSADIRIIATGNDGVVVVELRNSPIAERNDLVVAKFYCQTRPFDISFTLINRSPLHFC
jgi:hypothetical protein